MSVSELEAELSEDEQAGLAIIRESGAIHPSDFSQELAVSSRIACLIPSALDGP